MKKDIEKLAAYTEEDIKNSVDVEIEKIKIANLTKEKNPKLFIIGGQPGVQLH
ncbi:hypothetical protein [Campylobacter ureolyticus]|uniref:hypothetical protein n=1 Tax=Campylobacter ureolyticus TaxID=827 RepID=UPI001FC7C006|nr:hypothetical protein [Campylobacter ureolyticus]MCZ6106221.1 hypothetical protein [Campylobacter ureolyticus]MCZ6158775.1 hypothetical protein [Campylobacter ureolyticus]GKH61351.1 hypothetical protein CE91St25_16870 [Campylobacter ureolyticus]